MVAVIFEKLSASTALALCNDPFIVSGDDKSFTVSGDTISSYGFIVEFEPKFITNLALKSEFSCSSEPTGAGVATPALVNPHVPLFRVKLGLPQQHNCYKCCVDCFGELMSAASKSSRYC